METVVFGDAVRGAAFCAYLVVAGQIAYIIYHYAQTLRLEYRITGSRPKGLLLSHVITVSLVTAGYATQSLAGIMVTMGEPLAMPSVVTPLLLLVTAVALQLLMNFEYRRYSMATREVKGLADGTASL